MYPWVMYKTNISSITTKLFDIVFEKCENLTSITPLPLLNFFMTKLKYLDYYELSSTVNCLQGVNNLYIILMEEEKKNNNNNTKRVRFNVLQSKTKRRKAK